MAITTIIGLAAAACTTSSMLPQAIKTIKSKQTHGLSVVTYAILATGILLWLIYGIFSRAIPVIIANSLSLCTTSTILFLIVKYKKNSK